MGGDRTPAAPLWTPPPPPFSPSRPRGASHTHVQPWAAACSPQPSPLGHVLSSKATLTLWLGRPQPHTCPLARPPLLG